MYVSQSKTNRLHQFGFIKTAVLIALSATLLTACMGPREKPDDPPPKPGEGRVDSQGVQANATQVQLNGMQVPQQKASEKGEGAFSLASDGVKSRYVLPFSATCDALNKGESIALNWQGVPEGTQSFALGMYHYPNPRDEGDFSKAHVYWTQFDIPAGINALTQGQTDIGVFGPNTVNGALAYSAPCSKDTNNQMYTITLYALSSGPGELGLTAKSADLASLYQAISPYLLADASLTLQRARYNPKNSDHIPTEVATDCVTKSDDFAAYSDKVSVSCSDTELLVTSKTFYLIAQN